MRMLDKIPEEIENLLIKIIIPSLVAISIKLAVQSKQGKISLFTTIASIIVGVGCAYLSAGWVMKTFSAETMPIAVGVITISGEKIAYWLIFKLNVNIIGDEFINFLIKKYKGEN